MRRLLALALLGVAWPVAAQVQLTGAGSTFLSPLAAKWFDAWQKQAGVRINYQSIGSGGGVRQFTQGTVDFAATDGPMTDQQIAAVKGNVLHLPAAVGAVVLTYNLPSLGAAPLKLDGATIADIFFGRIQRWNDRRIAALNPGIALPALDLLVIHRSDGSGTTYVLTDYLAKVSPEWKAKVGTNTAVNWPVGLGGKGNEGVTQQVKQLEGAIGYTELVYARANKLPLAAVKNPAGQYVVPSTATTTAAAAALPLPAGTDFRVSLTAASGATSYPIASYSWWLVRTDTPDATKARALRDFLKWMVSPAAQQMAESLDYAPLPEDVRKLVEGRLATLKGAGRPI